MSYAGVESEYEYAQRIIRNRKEVRWQQSPAGIAAAAKREREEKERQLQWARDALVNHQKAVAETRKRIKRLERELSS